MDKNVIVFLIKLLGTFAILSLIIIVGRQLKSSTSLNENISYDPLYLESVAETKELQRELELQIQLENEERAKLLKH